MSSITLSSLKYIEGAELRGLLLAANDDTTENASKSPSIAVVDVRDNDHIGGHIRTSMHFPTHSLDATMPTLLRKLADKDIVVFHCALSQQRGPSAALKYLREKESKGTEGSEHPQKVYVLFGGFNKWAQEYGNDEILTEGFLADLHEF
ncbi:Rhodanese-like protein [Xylariaceae sp. FL1272]|nr:Rhodanese-like protein [Xylariaceae sp. FL1272]